VTSDGTSHPEIFLAKTDCKSIREEIMKENRKITVEDESVCAGRMRGMI
jgi:hypothetical protein